jgi:hypothetical protein
MRFRRKSRVKWARLVEEHGGLYYSVWFGKDLLTAGTNRERMQALVDVVNVGRGEL